MAWRFAVIGYVVFFAARGRGDYDSRDDSGAPGWAPLGWQVQGQALPSGAVPVLAGRNGQRLSLHDYPSDSDLVAAINAVAAEAEAALC